MKTYIKTCDMKIEEKTKNVNSQLIKKEKSFALSAQPKQSKFELKILWRNIELSRTPEDFFKSEYNLRNFYFLNSLPIRLASKDALETEFRKRGYYEYYRANIYDLQKRIQTLIKKKKKKDKPMWEQFNKRFGYKKVQEAFKLNDDLQEAENKTLYAICHRLHKGREIYQRELGLMIQERRQTVNACCQSLQKKGYLIYTTENGKIGKYELTEKGMKFFKKCFDLGKFLEAKKDAMRIAKPQKLHQTDSNIKIIELSMIKNYIEKQLSIHQKHILFYFYPSIHKKYQVYETHSKDDIVNLSIFNKMSYDKQKFMRRTF